MGKSNNKQNKNKNHPNNKDDKLKKSDQHTKSDKHSKDNKNVNTGKDDSAKSSIDQMKGATPNDPSGYFISQDQAKGVASIPFGRPAGLPVNPYTSNVKYGNGTEAQVVYKLNDRKVKTLYEVNSDKTLLMNFPSVMNIELLPIIGVAQNLSAAINYAAQAMYAKIRSVVSGSRPYEPNDLMAMILRVLSLKAGGLQMCSLAGDLLKYDSQDRNMPNALIHARTRGLVRDATRIDRLGFISRLTTIGAKLNALPLPNDLPIIQRYLMLVGSVFKDDELHKSQYYVFTMPFILKKIMIENHKPKLMAIDIWGKGYQDSSDSPAENLYDQEAIDEMLAFVEKEISNMLSDSDVGIICADILRAYGDNLLVSQPTPVDYDTPVTYSEEVLQMIRNLDIWTKIVIPEEETRSKVQEHLGKLHDFCTLEMEFGETYKPSFKHTRAIHAPQIGMEATQVSNGLGKCVPEVFCISATGTLDPLNGYSSSKYFINNGTFLIRTKSQDPTPDENFISTRFKYAAQYTVEVQDPDITDYLGLIDISGPNGGQTMIAQTAGTELVADVYVYGYGQVTPKTAYQMISLSVSQRMLQGWNTVAPVVRVEYDNGLLSSFGACPVLDIVNINDSQAELGQLVHDYLNYAYVNTETLEAINEVAILGLYRNGIITK